MMRRRREEEETKEKILDVDAAMQGTLTFRDPVNLRINGKFEGKLVTKGSLAVGEHAIVNADIDGETITVAGRVNGNIIARQELRLTSPAHIVGNIITPLLNIESGAILDGNCKMSSIDTTKPTGALFMSMEEVAKYLEVEPTVVAEWASNGRIPAIKEANTWKIERSKLDEWVANGKIK
ncbi:MAG: hypothetical protein COS99_02245 [Candidatus Omnitrophica bacterium CG07_land_8_20_14_0_80_42_15]|uniref:Helix-turn-helix domain-containing protein n=1 Tax=Candidatus Aquitaenariimonas noxiae TaxID=1974741 RepID=A0A2J0KW47_9BACT|nr:MAG: hypothetical protein COS99_02245 [Candidatus Omnitrophica bacterium CG07_land_8_20_14_0_80_42_15]